MLNIKNDNYKLLYDLEVSLKDSVEITKIKEGEKPSIMSDTMFKTMFYNDNRIKYGAKFLSYYLDITYEELLSKIKLTKESLNKEKERYALALIEKDIVTSKELGGGINIMEEYMEEVEKVMNDEYFGESYDKEKALQEEYYEIGKKAGIKKGVK